MNTDPIIAFGFGVAAGAAAIYVPWMAAAYRKYVVSCGKTTCSHHGDDNRKRLNDSNKRERHKQPPRGTQ